jgi:hypothetical protein
MKTIKANAGRTKCESCKRYGRENSLCRIKGKLVLLCPSCQSELPDQKQQWEVECGDLREIVTDVNSYRDALTKALEQSQATSLSAMARIRKTVGSVAERRWQYLNLIDSLPESTTVAPPEFKAGDRVAMKHPEGRGHWLKDAGTVVRVSKDGQKLCVRRDGSVSKQGEYSMASYWKKITE